jgi:hypothetical protein
MDVQGQRTRPRGQTPAVHAVPPPPGEARLRVRRSAAALDGAPVALVRIRHVSSPPSCALTSWPTACAALRASLLLSTRRGVSHFIEPAPAFLLATNEPDRVRVMLDHENKVT